MRNDYYLKMFFKNFSTGLDKAILGSDTKDSTVVIAAKTDMTNALEGLTKAFDFDKIYLK